MQTDRERLEVEKVIHDSIGWALTKDTDYAIKDLRLKFAELGNAARYSCMLDDHAEWNGQPTGCDNARWTGVLEKRNGQWVIVQMHFSFPKDN